ncbi:MAG: nucleoside phosphorylase [Promethearchaeia archaeon]
MKKEFPILEFDNDKTAVINPWDWVKPIDAPEHCVITFFKEVIDKLVKEEKAKKIAEEKTELGRHPIYLVKYQGREFITYLSGVTAPFAAALLEFVIQLGCKKFIVCGSAGSLDKSCTAHIIVLKSAIRDEGVSYHYIPPSREVEADPEMILALIRTLDTYNIQYLISKTWTTSAIYREIPQKIKLRREEGCFTVEMEAAALFAVAKSRCVKIAQLLYISDDVSGEKWDKMNIGKNIPIREKVFWLAVEACLKM